MSKTLDFEHLVGLCRRVHPEEQDRAAHAVDRLLVERNWLFGRYIVEFENGGADRSELYGKALIARLFAKLKAGGVKGCSSTNLCKFATSTGPIPRFNRHRLSNPSLRLRTPAQSTQRTSEAGSPSEGPLRHPPDHRQRRGAALLRDRGDGQRLERARAGAQIARSLYERLALSRDKAAVHRLSREGLVVEKAADLIKNPLVLEFPAGPPRPPRYAVVLYARVRYAYSGLASFLLRLLGITVTPARSTNNGGGTRRGILYGTIRGPVGKSFLTFIFATEYAEAHPEEMVYVIDMCPQANVSEIFLGGNGIGTKVLDRILKDHEDRKTNPGGGGGLF